MTEVPAGAKKPADRKAKADEVKAATAEFAHDGKTYTSLPLGDVVSPAFVRRNRHLEGMDYYFTLLEALYAEQPDAIAAIDEMDWDECNALAKDIEAQIQEKVGANPGE